MLPLKNITLIIKVINPKFLAIFIRFLGASALPFHFGWANFCTQTFCKQNFCLFMCTKSMAKQNFYFTAQLQWNSRFSETKKAIFWYGKSLSLHICCFHCRRVYCYRLWDQDVHGGHGHPRASDQASEESPGGGPGAELSHPYDGWAQAATNTCHYFEWVAPLLSSKQCLIADLHMLFGGAKAALSPYKNFAAPVGLSSSHGFPAICASSTTF